MANINENVYTCIAIQIHCKGYYLIQCTYIDICIEIMNIAKENYILC